MNERAALAAALLVLVLGIAAVATHDDDSGVETGNGAVASTPPTSSTSTSTSPSSSTSTSTSSTTTITSPSTTTSVTVRAAVASPEAAANGLIAAYRFNDRTQAQRFATEAVVDALFQQPYVPAKDPGFQGCVPQGADFLCTYLQPNIRDDMTVQRSDAGEFRVVALVVRST